MTFAILLWGTLFIQNAHSQSQLDEQVPYQGDTLLTNPNQYRVTPEGDVLMDCDWPTMMAMIRDLEERIAGETEADTTYGVYVSGDISENTINMWYDCVVLRDSILSLQVAYDEALAPRVTVDAAVVLSDTSTALSASVSGSGVEAAGFAWATDAAMTSPQNGPDTGTTSPIADTLTGLDGGTVYYFSAYAVKEAEYFYGDTLSFLTMPGITTEAADELTAEAATLNATFSADSITSQGFVWGLQADLSDGTSVSADTTAGSTAIEYSLTGLTQGTVYYFSVYATNASGTSHGDTLSFSPITDITNDNIFTAVNLWVSDQDAAIATYGHISDWNTSAVTSMDSLFLDKTNFDDDISGWDVSNVTDMSNMFQSSNFNQDIGNWDVSSVTNMYRMFKLAPAFNQDIGNWDVSSVTTMNNMFSAASAFNQDIGNWDVSSVVSMKSMFSASPFNQDIGNWDVSSVTDMQYMFASNFVFNQDIGNWDVSSVTDMESMFQFAAFFNQDLSTWCVDQIENEPSNFGNDSGTNPVWGTCPVVFTTCGDAIGYDGYNYATVSIGGQCWFAENLRNTNYNDGSAIPSVLNNAIWSSTTDGAVSVYDEGGANEASNLADYGRLYNWHAVNTGNLCPSGWHVPTDTEWTTLRDGLGGSSVAGDALKSPSWGGTNSSGFSGLPGGARWQNGSFADEGSYGYFWSSSQAPIPSWAPGGNWAWLLGMGDATSTSTFQYEETQVTGFSVRCVLGE